MVGEKRNKVRKGGKQGDGYSYGGYSLIKKHNQLHILAGYPQTHDIEKKVPLHCTHEEQIKCLSAAFLLSPIPTGHSVH